MSTAKTKTDQLESTRHRSRSQLAHERACQVLVGGVNSPVRAYGSVGGTPVTVSRAGGAYIEDLDGHRYLDFVGSWGPAIVGHAHPDVTQAVYRAVDRGLSFGAPCEDETNLAELILSALPGHDRIRFVSSGTEACMSAVRLARAATGRDLIIKFAGNYHGHADAMLVEAGSGAITHGVPTSPGINRELARATLSCRYNDATSVQSMFERHPGEIAAVLVEPVAGNMGLVLPSDGFLESVRELCTKHGALLVFDEVMTGFRVAWGGYQRLCGIEPDLTCLGKVIGGGMPVAAYAGCAEIMEQVSPAGPVYQAGTLSGNPVAMAAGLATLKLCSSNGFYDTIGTRTLALAEGLAQAANEYAVHLQTEAIGGMLGVAFCKQRVQDFEDAKSCDHRLFASFFHEMLDRGVWLPPSGYEAWFISASHTNDDVSFAVNAAREAFGALQ